MLKTLIVYDSIGKMTPEEKIKQLEQIKREAVEVFARCKLGNETTSFFTLEVQRLSRLTDNLEEMRDSDKEHLLTQLRALEKRMLYEKKLMEADDKKLQEVKDKLKKWSSNNEQLSE